MKEIHNLDELKAHVDKHDALSCVAIQEVDLTDSESLILGIEVSGTFFLGCSMSAEAQFEVQRGGAYIFQAQPDLPFKPFRATLYSPAELYDSFDPADPCSYCDCTDAIIYRYWHDTGKATVTSIVDAMFRGMHDRSISDALYEFLDAAQSEVVAIMGGHSLGRNVPRYRELACIARELTRKGYLMVSGGGPGAMEATHLGAIMAWFEEGELHEAIKHLSPAPSYRDERWLSLAYELRTRLDDGNVLLGESLGIPTWLYGHEPPTPFATHIAKYFNNSIREEGLITVAHAGIIFAPGSAGTIQEIFQEAAQNHYATTGYASPMVFLGKEYWERTKPVYPVLELLSEGHPYADLIYIVDSAEEAIERIASSTPVKVDSGAWNFCDAFCGK